jgi:hypothetical protein
MLLPLLLTLACKDKSSVPAPAAAPSAQRIPVEGDTIQIFVNGKPVTDWTPDRFSAVTPLKLKNHGGEDRLAWPLRELTRSLVGGSARVVNLVNDDEEKVAIAPSEWNDPSRTLVMRPSHRGGYKVQWMDAHGSSGDALLKSVRRLDIVQ